jgi:hypothetical protein
LCTVFPPCRTLLSLEPQASFANAKLWYGIVFFYCDEHFFFFPKVVDSMELMERYSFLLNKAKFEDLESQLFELERISMPHKICKKIYLGDYLSATNYQVKHWFREKYDF